jgi:hypothetical protein
MGSALAALLRVAATSFTGRSESTASGEGDSSGLLQQVPRPQGAFIVFKEEAFELLPAEPRVAVHFAHGLSEVAGEVRILVDPAAGDGAAGEGEDPLEEGAGPGGGDSGGGGGGFGVGGAGEMVQIDLLAFRVELDPAGLLALQEPAALRGDTIVRVASRGSAGELAAALVDGEEVERPLPGQAEDVLAGADVVEAAEREARGGGGLLAAAAEAQGFKEAGLCRFVDQPTRRLV